MLELRQRHSWIARLLAVAALAASLLVVAPPPADAAPSQVDRTCAPGPRGNACAALYYDSATRQFAARGAVDPNAGHVIRIEDVALTWCYGSTCGTAAFAPSTPTSDSGAYQVRWTPYTSGSRCYTWYAVVFYTVDRRDTYSAVTNGYGGLC
jgi:hypothetical protein